MISNAHPSLRYKYSAGGGEYRSRPSTMTTTMMTMMTAEAAAAARHNFRPLTRPIDGGGRGCVGGDRTVGDEEEEEEGEELLLLPSSYRGAEEMMMNSTTTNTTTTTNTRMIQYVPSASETIISDYSTTTSGSCQKQRAQLKNGRKKLSRTS